MEIRIGSCFQRGMATKDQQRGSASSSVMKNCKLQINGGRIGKGPGDN